MLSIIGIKVCLSSFVEALQQLFIVKILTFLIIKILIIIVLIDVATNFVAGPSDLMNATTMNDASDHHHPH